MDSMNQAAGQLTVMNENFVPKAVSQLAEMAHPNRPFGRAFEGRQCQVDFDNPGTSSWPGTAIESSCFIAALASTEFPIQVIAHCFGKSQLRTSNASV